MAESLLKVKKFGVLKIHAIIVYGFIYTREVWIMPAKKTVKTTEAAETETKTVKKAAAKKTTAKKAAETKTAEAKAETKTVKKTAAKKTAETKAAAEEKAPAKKTAAKKTTTKKTAEKAPAKKTAAKKTTAKKAEPKPEVVKRTVKDYEDIINWKKGEAHAMDWLYIEINAGDLLTEVEAGVDNLSATCNAILNCMLEGDTFIVEPAEENKVSDTLTVRYYCDNLSEFRKKYFDR